MRMPIRQLREAWPSGCPSVRSSAYDIADRTVDSFTVDIPLQLTGSRKRRILCRKAGRLDDAARLPQMPPLVGGHGGEAGAERHPDPGGGGRRDACAGEIEAVGLTQPID